MITSFLIKQWSSVSTQNMRQLVRLITWLIWTLPEPVIRRRLGWCC
jgi:hypothetical protein